MARFFGKLADADSPFSLRRVFWVRWVLSRHKRGQEHSGETGQQAAPDFIRINTRHVVLIEPAAADSWLAPLIR